MKKTFLSNLRALSLFGILASVIVLTSCGDDEETTPAPTNSIWEEISSRDNLTSLVAELEAIGLDAPLKAEGELTLFAPTNAALNTLLGTLSLEDFSTVSTDIANAVLAFHVADGTILASDLAVGTSFVTLQGESFTVEGGPALSSGATSDATFQVTNIATTNGTVHIIEAVMVPPTVGGTIVATLGTLAQPVLLGADFSTLAAGIQKADAGKETAATIIGALTAAQDLTVFAPTNATFEAAGVTVETLTAEQWDLYVRNHVVVGQGGGTDDGVNTLGPDDLTTGSTYTTFASTETLGQELFFVQGTPTNGLGIFIDSDQNFNPEESSTLNAEVVVADAVVASNGRIHVIAGILAPSLGQVALKQ